MIRPSGFSKISCPFCCPCDDVLFRCLNLVFDSNFDLIHLEGYVENVADSDFLDSSNYRIDFDYELEVGYQNLCKVQRNYLADNNCQLTYLCIDHFY